MVPLRTMWIGSIAVVGIASAVWARATAQDAWVFDPVRIDTGGPRVVCFTGSRYTIVERQLDGALGSDLFVRTAETGLCGADSLPDDLVHRNEWADSSRACVWPSPSRAAARVPAIPTRGRGDATVVAPGPGRPTSSEAGHSNKSPVAVRTAVRVVFAHPVGLLFALVFLAAPLGAQQTPRRMGPVIRSAGGVFEVARVDFETPVDMVYRVAFEVSEAAGSPTELNPGLNTVARFLNMHAQAGVPLRQLQVAVVVHGTAGKDLLGDDAYRSRFGLENPNAVLVRELAAAGVRLVLCGQTAASRGLPTDGLLEPVEVALSAMTALAVLQEEGYHVNPF